MRKLLVLTALFVFSCILSTAAYAEDAICPKCQTIYSDGSGFCTKDGTKLEAVVKCPACGKPNAKGTESCNSCGKKLAEADQPGAKPEAGENEKKAFEALRMLVPTEASWRQCDMDRNEAMDYWVGDVSGLYRILDGAGKPVKYITQELAKADYLPLPAKQDGTPPNIGASLGKREPYFGYYFQAMTLNQDGEAYQLDGDDEDSNQWENPYDFAFCAFPAEYGKTGTSVFIVNGEGHIWQKDTGEGKAVLEWPGEDPAKKGWKKLEEPKKDPCLLSLTDLGDAIASYKDKQGSFPSGTGRAFWKSLQKGVPDLCPDELLSCPQVGQGEKRSGNAVYRGPRQPLSNKWSADAIVACDGPENHEAGDMNVLFFDGHVENAKKGTDLYKKALEETVEVTGLGK